MLETLTDAMRVSFILRYYKCFFKWLCTHFGVSSSSFASLAPSPSTRPHLRWAASVEVASQANSHKSWFSTWWYIRVCRATDAWILYIFESYVEEVSGHNEGGRPISKMPLDLIVTLMMMLMMVSGGPSVCLTWDGNGYYSEWLNVCSYLLNRIVYDNDT